MLRPLFVFLILFAVATVIRFAVPMGYPEYIGQTHLGSSIVYALAVALSIQSLQIKFPANTSPGAERMYKVLSVGVVFVASFLMAFYSSGPSP